MLIIGFVDSVSHDFAERFLTDQGLEIHHLDANDMPAIWAEGNGGAVQNHITALEADSSVLWADHRGYPRDDRVAGKDYILIQFKVWVSVDYAKNVIVSRPGLTLKYIAISRKRANIIVPEGRENCWIERLRSYSFIRYVEQEGLGVVTQNN